MKLLIEILTDNAAFEEGPSGNECARILRKLADEIEDQDILPGSKRLYDRNGNYSGKVRASTE